MREVMTFSLVFTPYISPTFASKETQRSKLENVRKCYECNVMSANEKNGLSANVYLSDIKTQRFLHFDFLPNSHFIIFPSHSRQPEKLLVEKFEKAGVPAVMLDTIPEWLQTL